MHSNLVLHTQSLAVNEGKSNEHRKAAGNETYSSFGYINDERTIARWDNIALEGLVPREEKGTYLRLRAVSIRFSHFHVDPNTPHFDVFITVNNLTPVQYCAPADRFFHAFYIAHLDETGLIENMPNPCEGVYNLAGQSHITVEVQLRDSTSGAIISTDGPHFMVSLEISSV